VLVVGFSYFWDGLPKSWICELSMMCRFFDFMTGEMGIEELWKETGYKRTYNLLVILQSKNKMIHVTSR
jgi:hypothetical protein